VLFAAPPSVRAEVVFRLPDHLSRAGKPSAWLQQQRRGAPMGSFLEGPSFDAEGNLYVVDIPFGRIFRIRPDGRFEVIAEYAGQPNGLKIGPDGALWITDYQRGLLRMNPDGSGLQTVLDSREHRFAGLNDLHFHGEDCWFTDQGMSGLQDPCGRVMRWRQGMDAPQTVLAGIPSPNGIVVDPGGTTVLVAVTRANAVWRLPLMLDGSTQKVGVFVQLSGGFGPDGMALDTQGNLAVVHAGLGAVWLFSPRGEPLLRIDSPVTPVVTNCAYGGPDHRFLYITEADSGVILRAPMPAAGLVLPVAGTRA
jgi:gluconolactonase